MTPVFGAHTYSYTLREPALQSIARLADLGFASFEVMAHPGHFWPDELTSSLAAEMRRAVEAHGAHIVALNMPNIDINIAATTREMRQHTIGLLGGLVRLAGDLGVPGVIVGPGKPNPLLPAPKEQLTSYFLDGLEQLCRLADAHGTAIWVENMPFSFLPEARALTEVLDRFGDARVGTVFDFANAYFIGEDFLDGIASMRARLKLVHVSDTGRKVFDHAVLGAGTMPVDPIPNLLAATAYEGPVMLEIVSPHPEQDLVESRRRLAALAW